MSDLTTFRICVPDLQREAFIEALALHLEPAACEGRHEDASTGLRQTFVSLQSGALAEACLSLVFDEDEMLKNFRADDRDALPAAPGKVVVGCFWTTCKKAEGHCDIEFTSATRSISTLMKESASVRCTFVQLARFSADGGVLVIDEWHAESALKGLEV